MGEKRRRPRGLSDEDLALWQNVVEKATPLGPVAAPARVPPKTHAPLPQPPQKIRHFHLGERAAPIKAQHHLAPSLEESFARSTPNMDRRNFERLKRGKIAIEGRIDLHGMTLMQAHPALTGFIRSAHASGKRMVLVITGKGRGERENGYLPARPGALRHEVPHWLRQPPLAPLVVQIMPAHRKDGGSGAYYVYLRRQR